MRPGGDMTSASLLYPMGYDLDESTTYADARGATIEGSRNALAVDVESNRLIVRVEGEAPKWLANAIAQVQKIMHLKPGWDSYDSLPPDPKAARAALLYLGQIMHEKMRCPAIVPMSSGNIQLEWHASGVDIEIEVGPEGPVFASIEDLNGAVDQSGPIRPGSKLLNQVAGLLPLSA